MTRIIFLLVVMLSSMHCLYGQNNLVFKLGLNDVTAVKNDHFKGGVHLGFGFERRFNYYLGVEATANVGAIKFVKTYYRDADPQVYWETGCELFIVSSWVECSPIFYLPITRGSFDFFISPGIALAYSHTSAEFRRYLPPYFDRYDMKEKMKRDSDIAPAYSVSVGFSYLFREDCRLKLAAGINTIDLGKSINKIKSQITGKSFDFKEGHMFVSLIITKELGIAD